MKVNCYLLAVIEVSVVICNTSAISFQQGREVISSCSEFIYCPKCHLCINRDIMHKELTVIMQFYNTVVQTEVWTNEKKKLKKETQRFNECHLYDYRPSTIPGINAS